MSLYTTNTIGNTGPEFYNSGSFHGIKLFNEIRDNLDFDRILPCAPDIFISDSNTKVLLDYTGCIESSNSEYIKDIIDGISFGAGFTLQDAKYVDQITGAESDLSGFYTYAATFDKAIFATIADIPKAEDLDKKYSSVGFLDDFKAIFSVNVANTTEENVIKNVFGPSVSPSFSSLGLKKGDFVKILNGSNSSQTLHEVSNFYLDYNDHEIVQFGNSADFSDENRVGSSTDLRLYRNDSPAGSTETNTIIDGSGKAISVGQNSITELVGRVNLISFYAQDGKFYAASKEAPTILCNIGSSYVFNLTDSSLLNGAHLLRISSVEDGRWNGGSDHPDVYVTDNILLFEPKVSGTYYYYCKNHPNMGGIIQVASFSIDAALQQTPVFIDNSTSASQLQSSLSSGIYQ